MGISEKSVNRKVVVRHNHLQPTWVWRQRGSNSPESLCEFVSFAPVRAAVEAPPAPSPCSLGASGGRHSGGRRLKANGGNDYQEVVTRKLAVLNSFAKAKNLYPTLRGKTLAKP